MRAVFHQNLQGSFVIKGIPAEVELCIFPLRSSRGDLQIQHVHLSTGSTILQGKQSVHERMAAHVSAKLQLLHQLFERVLRMLI
ncbi:hypothetical protein D3C78_659620 [compost metagenome]